MLLINISSFAQNNLKCSNVLVAFQIRFGQIVMAEMMNFYLNTCENSKSDN